MNKIYKRGNPFWQKGFPHHPKNSWGETAPVGAVSPFAYVDFYTKCVAVFSWGFWRLSIDAIARHGFAGVFPAKKQFWEDF